MRPKETLSAARNDGLAGRRILVVEDEYFLANDLSRALADSGACVIGPLRDVEEGLQALQRETVDIALLDINTRGGLVYPLADELLTRGILIVFTTGYGEAAIPRKYAHVPRWEKPFDPAALAHALPELDSNAA